MRSRMLTLIQNARFVSMPASSDEHDNTGCLHQKRISHKQLSIHMCSAAIYSGGARISVRGGDILGVYLVGGPGAEPPGRRRIFENFL